jgi:hypothetical protein
MKCRETVWALDNVGDCGGLFLGGNEYKKAFEKKESRVCGLVKKKRCVTPLPLLQPSLPLVRPPYPPARAPACLDRVGRLLDESLHLRCPQ